MKDSQLHSDTTDEANIFNGQFQSEITPLSPLSLKELALRKVQDLVDNKGIAPDRLPEDLRNPTPVVPDIQIFEAGILNLLKKTITERQQVSIESSLSYCRNSERN